MSLIISLRSEVLKTKRTAAYYFTVIGAAVIPFLFLFNIITHDLPEKERTAKDPINSLFYMSSQMTGLCILPLFAILLCTLLPQIEYKNNSWKQALASPQTKANIYLAKFLNIHLLMLMFMMASHVFMWVMLIIAHFALPALHVLNHSFDGYKVLVDSVHSYIYVLGICSIQFWIGLRSNNFIAPVAIGVVSWLVGTIMVFEYKSTSSVYFPYCFPATRFSEQFAVQLEQVKWTSLGVAVVFLALGFLDFKRRRMAR